MQQHVLLKLHVRCARHDTNTRVVAHRTKFIVLSDAFNLAVPCLAGSDAQGRMQEITQSSSITDCGSTGLGWGVVFRRTRNPFKPVWGPRGQDPEPQSFSVLSSTGQVCPGLKPPHSRCQTAEDVGVANTGQVDLHRDCSMLLCKASLPRRDAGTYQYTAQLPRRGHNNST